MKTISKEEKQNRQNFARSFVFPLAPSSIIPLLPHCHDSPPPPSLCSRFLPSICALPPSVGLVLTTPSPAALTSSLPLLVVSRLPVPDIVLYPPFALSRRSLRTHVRCCILGPPALHTHTHRVCLALHRPLTMSARPRSTQTQTLQPTHIGALHYTSLG